MRVFHGKRRNKQHNAHHLCHIVLRARGCLPMRCYVCSAAASSGFSGTAVVMSVLLPPQTMPPSIHQSQIVLTNTSPRAYPCHPRPPQAVGGQVRIRLRPGVVLFWVGVQVSFIDDARPSQRIVQTTPAQGGGREPVLASRPKRERSQLVQSTTISRKLR